MQDMHDDDLIRCLQQIGEVKPTAEASRRALDRTRHALAAAPVLVLATQGGKWSTGGISLVAGVILLVGGMVTWLLVSPSGSGQRLAMSFKSGDSVCYRQTARFAGEQGATITHVFIRGDGAWRTESPGNGSYRIVDAAKRQSVAVYPAKNEAVVRKNVNGPQLTLYDALKNLPDDASAKSLPARQVDGQEVIGYLTNSQGHDVLIWINSQTSLPVRVECDWNINDGKTMNIVLDQFEFGKALDDALFSLEPPAGLKVTGDGAAEAPATPKDAKASAPLVLLPATGLGEARLGMPRNEIEAILGKAEAVDENKDGTAVLNYPSQGFSLTVHDKKGVTVIVCRAASQLKAATARDFAGKTDKGIALGASAADITAAYGKADSTADKGNERSLSYTQLGIQFTLLQDKLVQMSVSAK